MTPILSRLASDSDVHALLLYGPAGGIQDIWGDWIVRMWLCEAPQESGACGTCTSCQLIARQTHSDLILVTPMPPGNVIRMGQIKADTSLKTTHIPVKDFVRTPALRGTKKVVWIKNADCLNVDSGNALLKLLEEPPPYVKFVLVTSAVGRILTTIRSRCLSVGAPMPSAESLQELYGENAELAARIPHLAPVMFGEPETAREFTSIVRGLATAAPGSGLMWSERFRNLVGKLAGDDDIDRQGNLRALEAFATAVSVSFPEQNQWVARIVEAHRKIAGNGQAGIVLDTLFVQLVHTQ